MVLRALIPQRDEGSKGVVFWHFGVMEGIDHADEVGVFTVKETACIP
jgi:hypothetical protein